MRVLVTGRAIPTQRDRCTGQQLVQGFKEAGYDAVFYGCFYGEPYNFIGFNEVQSQDFDLVICTEMNDGMPQYLPILQYYRLKDVPRLYWDFDVSYHPNRSLHIAGQYRPDGFLVANKYFVDRSGFGKFGKPVLHLPYACSPAIHKRIPDQKHRLVGFVGSLTPERKQLMDQIAQITNNTQDVECATGVFGDHLVQKTNEFYLMFHNNQEACRGLVPGRPWESTACGTTLLMDQVSYEDFSEFLPEHLRDYLLVYNNDADIRRLISEWTEKRATLDLYGQSLMDYVHQNHSYKNRAERIVAWCKQQGIV